MVIFNDSVDEEPVEKDASGFVGMDAVTPPRALPPGMIRAGRNVWCDVDGLLQTRPAFRFNSLLNSAPGAGNKRVQGAGYYDTPTIERILAAREGKLYEVQSAGNNAANAALAGPTPSATADVHFAQLVDRMLYVYSAGAIGWSIYTGGAWSHGTVTQFSDASAMPAWGFICTHGQRAFAHDPATGKLYASAVLTAHNAADWVKTNNVIVGDGSGDPLKRAISSQSGRLVVLNEGSAWWLDTSAAAVANWTSGKITGLTGCVEGKTAVEIGQDIFFLSRHGVVSLGHLQALDSISPETSISAPVQPFIDRINWNAISTAWGTVWQNLYVLALPIDNATVPTMLLCYNTLTKRWATPWTCTLADANLGGGVTGGAFSGWTAAVVTRFGAKRETLLGDNTGRLLRLDLTEDDDESAAGDTQDIISWATTCAWTFDHPRHLKQPFWTAFEFYQSTATDVQVNLVRDGLRAYPDKALGNCEVIVEGLRTNNQTSFPLVFPIVFQPNDAYAKSFHIRQHARFQEAGLQFVSLAGRLKLRLASVTAFIDTPVLNQ